MKLRIESDGTSAGTHVLTEGGEEVAFVKSVRFKADVSEGLSRATIDLVNVPIKFTGEVKVRGGAGPVLAGTGAAGEAPGQSPSQPQGGAR